MMRMIRFAYLLHAFATKELAADHVGVRRDDKLAEVNHDKSVDKSVDGLFNQIIETPLHQHDDLDRMTLGTQGHPAISNRVGSLLHYVPPIAQRTFSRPYMQSKIGSASFSKKQLNYHGIGARAGTSARAVSRNFDGSLSGKGGGFFASKEDEAEKETEDSCRDRTVAVFGATGRTGRLVVQRLLSQGYCVRALIRNQTKASESFKFRGDESGDVRVDTQELDLGIASEDEMRNACQGVTSVIWCASGFTKQMQSIDLEGMRKLVAVFTSPASGVGVVPRIVMCSSAAVSRPSWDNATKEKLAGAADIPIVNLNPGNVLNLKLDAEQILRKSGVPYCIVRPTGLKFGQDWPSGRPLLSQGDVAVGRTNAEDLASILVSVLKEPSSTGKTFEMFTLQGYPAPRTITPLLEPLRRDDEGPLDAPAVEAYYKLLQQLLPGEEQDATKLEMGRTYEQVDRGEVARTPRAAPTERERALASGVARSGV